ncbi:hypothetical protein HYH02_002777 [Chlamydomonas schloesseri]|uniref:Uncharacterized protein n=1 Tax=Chlamydomonas schloesseri TaxID=2026947 RepID=A0A835WSE3_9CHLO|nr:hypothetical protein HYH02_002777 [Chlamydomonas schloesseri]|eukprot:KAG2452539.1 hypothetical protein HYH02_002777 [Chlamydomonas schloesseri]
MDGLSIVPGAAHRHDAKDRLLRSSFKHSMGSASASTPGDNSPRARPHTADSSRPKLVQGDYTYTTARRNLTIASQQLGADLLPAEAVLAAAANGSAGAPLGVPSLRPASASSNATNMAAWKAYGSPAARGQPRPAPAPPPSHANTNPHMFSSVSSKPPRVQALGGGFRLQRPHSAPSTGPANGGAPYSEHHYQHHHLAHTHYAAQPGSPSSPGSRPPRQPSSPTRRQGGNGLGPRGALGANPAVLGVEVPDVLGAGKTDSGKVMFEHTLPTDPYSKFLWEEQARKARASMSRHIANMAVAASVNGGGSAGNGAGGGGGGSRPASALRTGSVPATPVAYGATGAGGGGGSVNGWNSSQLSTASAVVAGGGVGSPGVGMRARFSSATIAAMQRQGPDHRPHLVVGFAAPDIAEDTTLPGPGDPRWAYTRLGRTQIDRLQAALKMTDTSRASRPTSAPALALRTAGRSADLGTGGWGITGGGGAVAQEADSPGLPPVSERPEEEDRVVYTGGASGRVPRFGGVPAAAGGAGLDIGHSPRFAGGEAPPLPPRRPSSGSTQGGLSTSVSVAAAADAAGSGPVGGVRGSSAGRGRELAPNPRVDLRAYLADEQAEAAEAQAEADAEAAEAHALAALEAEAAAAAAALAEHGGGPLPDDYLAGSGVEAYDAQNGLDAAAQDQQAAENPYLHGAEAADADAAVQAATVAVAVADAMQSIPVPADDLAAKLAAVAAQRQEAMEREEPEHAVASVEGGAEESALEQQLDADMAGAQWQAVQQRHADAGGEDALRALHGGAPARPHSRYGAAAAAAVEYGDGGLEGQVGDPDGGLGIEADDGEAAGGDGDCREGYDDRAMVEDDGAAEGDEDVALGTVPIERAGSVGSRRTPSGHLRPTSARPTSARPASARPGAGNPLSPARGGSGSGRMQRQGSGVGAEADAGFDVGMDVIHEHSETAAEMDL